MASTDPRIDAYIAAAAPFAQPILVWFRARVNAACPDAVETIKWRMPFFIYRDKPLANMAAFKAHARFGFWDRDGAGGEDDKIGRFGQIESLADLPEAGVIEAMVREGVARIDGGAKTVRAGKGGKSEIAIPPELVEALAGDSAASATFEAFPPSCRREYAEWIAEAKRPETKAKRVADAIEWLREGKRRNWKYENG